MRITDKSTHLYGCPRRFGIRRDACINFVHVGEILDVGQKHVYRNQVFNLKTGIPILEITMTVPHALDVLAKVVKLYDDAAVVGAGTVTNAGDAQRCIKAGAKFLVTPGLSIPVLTTGKGLNTLAIYRCVHSDRGDECPGTWRSCNQDFSLQQRWWSCASKRCADLPECCSDSDRRSECVQCRRVPRRQSVRPGGCSEGRKK